MDFVGGGSGGVGGGGGSSIAAAGSTGDGLGSDNGPILYSEPNRTSAIDDIRSVVIYVFIITIFVSFFLILPGIRYEKFPTFLCITTSLIVTSIILVALFGTNWHVGEASISAAYKAFSRDKIQGELSVRIGFQSVNITLQAHKYFILHATHGPIIMDNTPMTGEAGSQSEAPLERHPSESRPPMSSLPTSSQSGTATVGSASSFISATEEPPNGSNLAEELLGGKTSDGSSVDTELDVDEVFAKSSMAIKQQQQQHQQTSSSRRTRSSNVSRSDSNISNISSTSSSGSSSNPSQIKKRSTSRSNSELDSEIEHLKSSRPNRLESGETFVISNGQRYTIKRVNVDINYNERFYWIEPNQMRQEHQNALQKGLPYPILTVVEYLSQDEAGFSWSRQYRSAGYYSYIILWLSFCVCVLMFFLHCAAPKYGIYAMIILGCLLLSTNLTYALLVPRGEQKLVIPFEGQPLVFKFGWNYWLVLIGGALSLVVGTLIVIIDSLYPNFIFTTILDVDFDSHNKYYKHRRKRHELKNNNLNAIAQRPSKPPFLEHHSTTSSNVSSSSSLSSSPKTMSPPTNEGGSINSLEEDISKGKQVAIRRHKNLPKLVDYDKEGNQKGAATRLGELFVAPSNKRSAAKSGDPSVSTKKATSDSESVGAQKQLQGDSSVPIEMVEETDRFAGRRQHHSPVTSANNDKRYLHNHQQHHYDDSYRPTVNKNGANLKSTDHLTQTAPTNRVHSQKTIPLNQHLQAPINNNNNQHLNPANAQGNKIGFRQAQQQQQQQQSVVKSNSDNNHAVALHKNNSSADLALPVSYERFMDAEMDLFSEEGKNFASFAEMKNHTSKKSSKRKNQSSKNKTRTEVYDDETSADSSDSNEIFDDVDEASGLAGTQKEPDCASPGRYYCTYKEEYPLKLVVEVTKYYKWPLEKLFRDLHAQIMPKLAPDSTGNLVCDSITRVVRPGWARNTNDRWLVVINNENYHQYVTEVVCQYGTNSRCNFIPPCYYSSCQQRYNTQKLLVIDPLNPYRGPFLSEFLFPSCCVCYIPSASDNFKDKYRSSPATIYQRTMQQDSANNLHPPQIKPVAFMDDVGAYSFVDSQSSSQSRVSPSSSVLANQPTATTATTMQKQASANENQAPAPGEIRREGEQYRSVLASSAAASSIKEFQKGKDNNLIGDFPRLGLTDSLIGQQSDTNLHVDHRQ